MNALYDYYTIIIYIKSIPLLRLNLKDKNIAKNGYFLYNEIFQRKNMAKSKTKFVCTNCGAEYPKMMGRCTSCGEFNKVEEEIVKNITPAAGNNRYLGITKNSAKVENLDEVKASTYQRKTTGINEFDRVLGGGLVNGGVILLGGDPGIGKSTLLLQTVSNLVQDSRVLYVSGEESSEQIALRAVRLNLPVKGVRIYSEIELEKIQDAIDNEKPDFVIIDSIQTLFSSQLSSAPGSVSQVKECASQLNRLAKETGVTMIIICHVTKEGELAGPRALEHIVDTVLYFEGDKNNQYRMIRAFKNRFGAINEIGIFAMTEAGLEEVDDPAGIFSGGNEKLPGSSIFVSQEGNRSILVEIQALLDQTPLPNPIRRSIGLDINRLQMLCAVIHKYIEMPIYSQNVFVSLIGGMKFSDTGIDLPAFLAMISSNQNVALPPMVASFGEIGLTGELRAVQNSEDRIREAARMGVKKIIVPRLNSKKINELQKSLGIEIAQCSNLAQAIEASGIIK
jgi:DNA repair protein RadA/Sms